MEEVVSFRLTREEKRLAQALAARRDQLLAELLRELLLSELHESYGASG